ncbi:DUF551 domain-containing protein [Klebsiella pneumoniae]|uniref:DUF551 domain-containing protein n=1 Tax=Klebsiella pneumoniae TaxID=573 RepID=UPI000E2D7B49|nr:Eaa1 [Klebsiella pneumoniae]SWW34087.1 Eaa1 [Klebsiella pneumoniae]SWW60734.1 Eaa1 [Klebsiella pneumoniae]
MTKSTITREQVVALIAEHSYDSALVDALEHLLSAMDSEPVEMPLDYLQGHKDGLEWASQLAEANHPETGDWIYDDPIELAKAIRKGPDMPPVQPVADSEPDRNPVLAYADSYRDMAKQGVESVPIWSVITDLERNIAPLYRHAQPAPVVPEEKPIPNTLSMYAVDAVAAIAEVKGWNACRAAMLAAAPQSPGGDHATVPGKWIPVSERLPEDSGRYWCYVEEQNDLGKSHYQWNCSWNGDRWWVESEGGGIVTHWMPLPAAPQEVNRE